MSSWFTRFVEPSMKITPETNPVMMMRRNQRLYPVPEKFKTSGQYYHRFLEGLTGAVRTTPLCWVGPIRKRESEFHSFLGNIRYAAACIIRKYYLRYKMKRELRNMHRQRACVLIQRNFRRYSAQLRYEFWIWNEGLKEQQRNRTVAESIEYYWAGWKQREEAKERDERELMKAEEQEMEASNEYSVGGCDCSLCCEQMDDDWIEMETERDAKLEEDMERMREEYFY